MNKLVLLFIGVLFFCTPEKTQAQEEWQIGLGGAVVRFPDENIAVVGEHFLFQAPRLSASKKIDDRFSISGAISFNSIEISEISKNESNYFSIDSFLRYHVLKEAKILDPYAFVGASLISVNIGFKPALNLGFGGTIWVFKNIGVNSQAMYKLTDKNNSHFQFTAGLVFNINPSL